MNFELTSAYKPTGDQPEAIAQLTEGVLEGVPAQTLLGVTGSGKTFTIANVIANINKPTLILSHNKTLAAQLYSEFKGFFPNNAVEYYVSYYDYYQPEAYLPSSWVLTTRTRSTRAIRSSTWIRLVSASWSRWLHMTAARPAPTWAWASAASTAATPQASSSATTLASTTSAALPSVCRSHVWPLRRLRSRTLASNGVSA